MAVPAIRAGKEGGVIRAGLIPPVISLPLFEIIISVDSSETSDAHDRDADEKRSFYHDSLSHATTTSVTDKLI
jgi:hypothetical protein